MLTREPACFTSAHRLAVMALAMFVLAFVVGCANRPTEYAYQIESKYAVDDPQFQRTMGSLLGPPIIPGNTVETYLNGDEIFPAMLQAIAAAKKTISFETYVYWSGEVGMQFTDALSERAKAGVSVHVLIDAVGSTKIDKNHLKVMKDAGVEFVLYHALKWFDVGSAKKINNRTHRKLLVVDGALGFTGGVGIADVWMGHAQDPKHWRDTHYCVKGPIVGQLQSAFMDDWMEATGEVLHDQDYFPPLADAGSQFAQFFKSSYRGGSESMHLMYLLSIAAARKNIRLATSYFVPDKLTIKTLLEARARGVHVQIIVPGPVMDEEIVRKASRAHWGDLLKAGVQIYEYQPTMFHCKLMVVDDLWTSIGSSNLDNRSFRLNCEANLNVLDAAFAAQQAQIYEVDLARSREITYEQWKNRPLHEKLMEHLASLLGSQL